MPAPPGLSPSRANDFAQCPLLFRLRSIDRIPEPPSRAATLGTLVHAVLEELFDAPPAQRTPATCRDLLMPAWDAMVAAQPELAELVADSVERQRFFDDARARLGTYFVLENPERLEPAARELRFDVALDGGPHVRGIVDRMDVAPNGAIRIIDYKTGATPRAGYGAQADFQMRFYALLVTLARGRTPALMRLLYLRDGGVKELQPTEADIASVETEIRERWAAIRAYAQAGQFPTRPSRLCGWCAFQSLCPEFGGSPPPLDADAVEAATGVRPNGSGDGAGGRGPSADGDGGTRRSVEE